jgi:hypothetical protein
MILSIDCRSNYGIAIKYVYSHIKNVTDMVDKWAFFGHNIVVELLITINLVTKAQPCRRCLSDIAKKEIS